MTRETKIGLLVGLAFIIVIGVLIGDHIQSVSQPQAAVFTEATNSASKSVAIPGGQAAGAVAMKVPDRVEPRGSVATSDQPVAPVPAPSPVSPSPLVPAPVTPVPMAQATNPGGAMTPTDPAGKVGLVRGSEVAPVGVVRSPDAMAVATPSTPALPFDGRLKLFAADTSGKVTPVPPAQDSAATVAMTKYTAVDGDNLTKIVIKFFGKWTPEKSDLILKANPQMNGNPDKIAVGKVYMIPSLSPTAQANSTPAPLPAGGVQKPASPLGQVTPVAVAGKPTLKTYTVKEGDSLWKIANNLGRSQAEIEAANKDVLKSSRSLKIGLVLKIPNAEHPTMASAQ